VLGEASRQLSGRTPRREPKPAGHGTASPLATIFSGLGWNASGQVATGAIFVGLTPFLLARLGVALYGVLSLVSTFRGLLSNLDGGLGPCADQHFALYAGVGDRRRTSSFLLTVSLMTVVVVGTVAVAGVLVAPSLAHLLHGSAQMHAQAAALTRDFMPLLPTTALRSMLMRILQAEHQWRYVNICDTVGIVAYAGGAVLFVSLGLGLIGVFLATALQELVLLVLGALGARRYVRLAHCRLLSLAEIRSVVAYALRVQVAEIASSLTNEVNTLLVGLLFPIRYVTYYSVGTNFANSLASLPMNAYSPIAVTLARTFGRAGLRSTVSQFTQLQAMWVRSVAAFPLVGVVAVYVAIPHWLGPQEHLAGVVAAITLLGLTPAMLSSVMAALGKAVNRPGLESRYLGLATGVALAAVVPLALWLGMLGVPIAAALAQCVSALYLLRLTRRHIEPSLRSFVHDLPTVPLLVALATAIGLEALVAPLAPRGAIGLAVCAAPAGAALLVYVALSFGVKTSRARLHSVRSRSPALGIPTSVPAEATTSTTDRSVP